MDNQIDLECSFGANHALLVIIGCGQLIPELVCSFGVKLLAQGAKSSHCVVGPD